MCLAIPGEVETIEEGDLRMGRVRFGGITREVCLEYVPDAGVGAWVLVHVGFAISQIDEEEARRVFELLDTLEEPAEYPT